MPNTMNEAIEALVEKRIRQRLDSYNSKILRKIKHAQDGGDSNFRRHRIDDWFQVYVMEKE